MVVLWWFWWFLWVSKKYSMKTIAFSTLESIHLIAALRVYMAESEKMIRDGRSQNKEMTQNIINHAHKILEKICRNTGLDPETLKSKKGNSLFVDKTGEIIKRKKK